MNLITRMEGMIHESYSNIGGMVVLKKGKKLYENYFNGCTAESTLHVFSVTKSIVSVLIGIAIDHGHIRSIEQKVLDFFPDFTVEKDEETIRNITLRNLLTMTAPYKFEAEPYEAYFTSDNWVKFSLDSLGGIGEIGDFRYAPLIGPDILSGILVKATGRSVLDFAVEYLFSPLGISVGGNVVFRDVAEQMAFYQATNISGWVADRQGINAAGWGLTLTAMDMAKIGQLFLNGGTWEGRQIVSAQWINESQKVHSQWNDLSYGYLWWIIDAGEQACAAMGDGGNAIYVNVKKEMVVSIPSLFIPNAEDRIKLIKEYIEPAFDEFYMLY